METPESDQQPLSPSQEAQCPPGSAVGRRSVEVQRVVEEFFCPCDADDERFEGKVSITTRASTSHRHTSGPAAESGPACYGADPNKENAQAGVEEQIGFAPKSSMEKWVTVVHPRLPASEHQDAMKNESPQSYVPDKQNSDMFIVNKNGVVSKLMAERLTPSKSLRDGYEAAFLQNRMRAIARCSQSPALSSPRESLTDMPCKSIKHVFDHTGTDIKSKTPMSRFGSNQDVRPFSMGHTSSGMFTSSYTKRYERSLLEQKEIRKSNDNRHLLCTKDNSGLHINERANTSSSNQPSKVSKQTTSNLQVADIKVNPANRKSSFIFREENKRSYYKDLSKQVEDKRKQREQERRRNTMDEFTHVQTMQFGTWGKPGSGAPNYNNNTRRRTKFSSIGIMPQEQLPQKGFSGIPFYSRVK